MPGVHYGQAQNGMGRFRFGPAKWKPKEKIDYRFSYQRDRWDREKRRGNGEGK